MNPLAIVVTVGATAGFVAVIGYLAYRVLNANEPHKSYRTNSQSHAAANSTSCCVGKCTICLREIELSNMRTLTCTHVFHRNCIQKWLQNEDNAGLQCPNCPVCTICLKRIDKCQSSKTYCKHIFHTSCITKWIGNEDNIGLKCPTCSVCNICFKNFSPTNGIRTTLECGHIFHTSCIKKNSGYSGRRCPDCPFCTICFEEIKTNQRTLKCKHIFHNDCLQKWLDEERTCPNCKKNV